MLYLVTLEDIHEDWKDLESDTMLTGSGYYTTSLLGKNLSIPI